MKVNAAGPRGLLLASASPRRQALLRRQGLHFEIRPAAIEEDDSGRHGAEAMVEANALRKTAAVVGERPDWLVLGADTTVCIDDVVLSKPSDLSEARAMLTRLSGRRHSVYTAVALRWDSGGFAHTFVESSEVLFRELGAPTIEAYLAQVDPLDKAGAYGIQEGRELIVESVEGCVDNVMGLPIGRVLDCFREQGFDFRDSR